MDVLELTDIDARLDFTPELPCEGANHASGTLGHMPEAPGAILLQAPCCTPGILHCEPRIAAMRCLPNIECSVCHITWPIDAYTFTRV